METKGSIVKKLACIGIVHTLIITFISPFLHEVLWYNIDDILRSVFTLYSLWSEIKNRIWLVICLYVPNMISIFFTLRVLSSNHNYIKFRYAILPFSAQIITLIIDPVGIHAHMGGGWVALNGLGYFILLALDIIISLVASIVVYCVVIGRKEEKENEREDEEEKEEMEHIMTDVKEITLAGSLHKKELIELWAEAFGDDESFISQFIDAYMIPEYNVPVALVGGKVVSAFYLIDFELYSNLEQVGVCSYLFAAATKKEHRNTGLMSELIKYAAELYKNRRIKAIFLFPQNQDARLFEYYSKFGFKNIYQTKKIYSGKEEKEEAKKYISSEGLCLQEEDIKNTETLDKLYNAYIDFSAKQALSPVKDRFFYFKCASVYLDSPEKTTHFAIFKNNVENFCYLFYKKSKNVYNIDDIIFLECDENSKNKQEKINRTLSLLAGYIKNQGCEYEINASPMDTSDINNFPLGMILPLDRKIAGIVDNLKIPVYLNMFMNL